MMDMNYLQGKSDRCPCGVTENGIYSVILVTLMKMAIADRKVEVMM